MTYLHSDLNINTVMENKTIGFYLENAHVNLVQAAKIAHLERDPDAETLSGLIDSLENLFERFCPPYTVDQD